MGGRCVPISAHPERKSEPARERRTLYRGYLDEKPNVYLFWEPGSSCGIVAELLPTCNSGQAGLFHLSRSLREFLTAHGKFGQVPALTLYFLEKRASTPMRIFARNVLEVIKSLKPGTNRRLYWVSRYDKCFLVTDGTQQLYFVSYWRRFLYERGIDARLDALFYVYGLDPAHTFSPGEIVVDVGANIGEFSLAASKRGATVIALEPDSAVFDVLLKNVSGNDRVKPHKIALWKEDNVLEFYSSPVGADSSLIEPEEFDIVTRIHATSLVHLCDGLRITDIALLKVEAEGAEPEVLEGAREMFPRIRMIVVDCSPERHKQSPAEEVKSILMQGGFAVREFRYSGINADIGKARRVVIANNSQHFEPGAQMQYA